MAHAVARSHAAPATQVAALLAVGLAVGCRAAPSASALWRSPESAVRRALAAAAVEGFPLAVPGLGALRLSPTRVSEVVVSVEGPGARILFRATGEGRIAGRHVGYVGGESTSLALGEKGWAPGPDGWLPRLRGVLAALAHREAALRARDGRALAALATRDYRDGWLDRGSLERLVKREGALGALPPIRAWLVRIEGGRATVAEVTVRAEDGSVGEETRRLELEEGPAGWRFTEGLL